MKISPLILGLAASILAPVALTADPVEIPLGERKESVLQSLGPPNGHVGSAEYEVYYFDRGEVSFRNGRLASHTLIPTEQLRARQLAAEHERRARAEAELARREELAQQGLDLRDRMLTDPAFATLPAHDRVVFWQSFRQAYPQVDVDFHYLVASRQAAQDTARRTEERRQAEAEQQRLRQLELRFEEAERQARLAERRARSHYYPPSHSTFNHYPHRPPLVIVTHQQSRDNEGNRRVTQTPAAIEPLHPQPARAEPSALASRGLSFDQRAAARQQSLDEDWSRRQQAFDNHATTRQRDFDARWEAARRF
jgi:hypothetical protein